MTEESRIKKAILNGIVLALVPLARLCLRNSLKLQNFLEAVKLAFVKAAEQSLEQDGDKVSVSRISVMTGLNRRDVKRLSTSGIEAERFPDLTSKILANWQNLPEFSTKQGKPRVLSVEGAECDFTELVRSVSADLAPYTVLYELERLGLVTKSKGKLKMHSRIHVSLPGDFEDGFAMLGEDIADLSDAVEENLRRSGAEESFEPHLHLKTEYGNIASEHIAEVRDWILTEGSAFHRKVRDYLSGYDLDVNPKLSKGVREGKRVAYVSFSFTPQQSSNSKEKDK